MCHEVGKLFIMRGKSSQNRKATADQSARQGLACSR